MSQEISHVSLSGAQQIASVRNSDLPAFQQQQPTPSADNNSVKASTSDTVKIDTANFVPTERLQRIENNVTDKSKLATQVRETDSALDAVNSHVKEMKAKLDKIVKNYPPFFIDNKERMEILRSYISLRKEIDSMTIPAPPPQPGVQLKSEILQDKGLAGLLPGELATNAPDTQVHSAYEQLGNAVQAISDGKQELRQTLLAKE